MTAVKIIGTLMLIVLLSPGIVPLVMLTLGFTPPPPEAFIPWNMYGAVGIAAVAFGGALVTAARRRGQ